jgi:hypothetical protein
MWKRKKLSFKPKQCTFDPYKKLSTKHNTKQVKHSKWNNLGVWDGMCYKKPGYHRAHVNGEKFVATSAGFFLSANKDVFVSILRENALFLQILYLHNICERMSP